MGSGLGMRSNAFRKALKKGISQQTNPESKDILGKFLKASEMMEESATASPAPRKTVMSRPTVEVPPEKTTEKSNTPSKSRGRKRKGSTIIQSTGLLSGK